MDMLRSCYRSTMRLFRDRPDVLTEGRWWFCQPGAKFVPFPHLFGSSNWDGVELTDDPPLGETGPRLGYLKARGNPRLLGRKVCGARTLWQNGSLYAQRGTPAVDAEGVPQCCDPTRVPFGPAACGGTAEFDLIPGWTGTGGLEIGGAGDFAEGFQASGGLEIGGAGDFAEGFQASGGIAIGGSGDFGVGFGSSGGVVVDGAGAFGVGWPGEGGIDLDGEGDFAWGFLAMGGLVLNGEGDFETGGGDVFPPGVIVGYGAASAPTDWLLCDGSAVSRATYATLFGIIGTTFGAGDGSTTFNLPDLRSRVPIGAGSGSGLTTRNLNDSGGVETVTLTTTELPAHTHAQAASTVLSTGALSGYQSNLLTNSGTGGTTGSAGTGSAFSTMTPYRCIAFIIKT